MFTTMDFIKLAAMFLVIAYAGGWLASKGWYAATPAASEPVKVLVQYNR